MHTMNFSMTSSLHNKCPRDIYSTQRQPWMRIHRHRHKEMIDDEQKQDLISTSARLAYPIRDDIPVMLEEEARQINEEEYQHYKKKK